ncbi:hypothetical protein BDD12DRAFT_877189 [Trichophaea hybrida]|nr:hypothetical protein BDD12DRAFT_877189 [Trichophaea hybrida]
MSTIGNVPSVENLTLDEMIFAISQTNYNTPLEMLPKSKHLMLLDLLALLFVTGDKSDMAVTMLTTKALLKFFYCKNKSCTNDEKVYARKLFEYACQTKRDAADCRMDLLAAVVDKYEKMIRARSLIEDSDPNRSDRPPGNLQICSPVRCGRDF